MKSWKFIIAASAFSLIATGVSAASYTFDLENPSHGGDAAVWHTNNSFSITHGDLTGTFTGRYIEDRAYDMSDKLTGDDANDAYSIGRWKYGAGVYNTTSDGQHTVDGKGYNDFVEMAFDYMGSAADVTLSSLSFGYIAQGYSNTNSLFELIIDTTGNATINLGDMLVYSGNAANLVDLSGLGLVDDVFGVLAGDGASWKLRAVTVDYSVSEVPLPAAIWLMMGSLGGLAALRRRRNNT